MADPPADRPERLTAAHLLLPLGALLCLHPAMTTGLGLLLGLALALLLGNPYLARTRHATRELLSLAVVGLGAGMDLHAVARAGRDGIGFTLLGIGATLALGLGLSRLLELPRKLALLITAGTAICGGSAIAALVPVLQPEEHETSVALGCVFLLNAAALFLFPPLGHALHLSDHQFGLWSAVAIHDTSSVVGAAVAFGGSAAQVATPVKLFRALFIVPLTFGVERWQRHQGAPAGPGAPRRPWFIAGFLLAAALVTFVPALHGPGQLVARGARQVLVVTLFLIGSGLTRASLRAVGARPLGFAVLLWILAGLLGLLAVAGG